ncbi:MAG TPA: GntR family transcriptional regulator [Trueperaceae bacterium]|jgi:GntR family transcriptional regulator
MAKPLYKEVESVLRSQVTSGRRAVGSKLPTESELCEIFDVSRDTVRKALRSLKELGLVKAVPGVGTMVVRSRPNLHVDTLRPLSAPLREAGLSLDVEVLDVRLEVPDEAVRGHLKLAPGEKALRVRRAHKIAGRPFSITTYNVPEWVGIGLDADFTGTIYELVEEKGKSLIDYGTDQISARMPTEEEKRLLAMPESLPILLIRRTAFTDLDRAVQYLEAAVRSDLYEYAVTLPRSL